MRIQHRGAKVLGVIALGVLPLAALTTPASAVGNTVTLTVGPVVVPSVPVEVCLDASCTPTTPMLNVTLKAEATTDVSVQPVVLTKSACPDGRIGAAIKVTSDTAASASVKVTATGTGTDGQQKTIVVGPQTVTVDVPGVVVSACTTD